jgi:hypothetical protein
MGFFSLWRVYRQLFLSLTLFHLCLFW